MRKILMVTLVLLLLAPFAVNAGDMNSVVVKPTMKINMSFQSGVSIPMGEQPTDHINFALKRLRLILSGDVLEDKIGYMFQGEGLGEKFLLDMKLIFKNYLPYTSISVGRFLPNYTYYQPQSVAKINFVNYPLLTLNYASWRQVGFESRTKISNFDLTLGLFNGIDVTDSWSDNNDAKDFLGRLDYSFEAGSLKGTVGVYDWFGFANGDVYNATSGDWSYSEQLSLNRMGVFVAGEASGARYAAEYVMGSQTVPETPIVGNSWSRVDGVGTVDVSTRAMFVEGMYRVGDVEGLVRWDDYDPDVDVDDN